MNEASNTHWIPLSDLMMGLMMVFLLLATLYMLRVEQTTTLIIKEYEITRKNLKMALQDEFSENFKEWNAELLGDRKYFIVDDMSVEILFHNDRALDVTLPNFIELKISETEPGARGDTATNVMKPAILENGYELNVPIFINEGDLIRIDTRSGEYADRVAKG